jgi:hypothetical protein
MRVGEPIRHQLRRLEKAAEIIARVKPRNLPGPTDTSGIIPVPYLFTLTGQVGAQSFQPPSPPSPVGQPGQDFAPVTGAASLVILGPSAGNTWPAGGTLTLTTPKNTIIISNFMGLGVRFDTPGDGQWTVTPNGSWSGPWSISVQWPFTNWLTPGVLDG